MNHHDFLDEIFNTSHLAHPIPGDADGPYPWIRCENERCLQRMRARPDCVCSQAEWTHFLALQGDPTRSDEDVAVRDLRNEHAIRSACEMGAAVVHTRFDDALVLLLAAPNIPTYRLHEILGPTYVDREFDLAFVGSRREWTWSSSAPERRATHTPSRRRSESAAAKAVPQ